MDMEVREAPRGTEERLGRENYISLGKKRGSSEQNENKILKEERY